MNRPTANLNLLVLRSQNIERLAEFYSSLGFRFERHRHGKGPEHYSTNGSGVVLEIYPAKSADSVTLSLRLGFEVDRIDEMHSTLLVAGATQVSPPSDSEWGRRSVIDDPDGNRVELLQARQRITEPSARPNDDSATASSP